ncbi:MAG TPA: nucleotide sugar dehydrogenase [Candidatus Dormibacteraeota bacterium]|nr:nucleotide sugar dehydrogenase [Candidatus Dormibacteraeota bacterium]
MNIGFIGLGKLGMPCAVAMASKGHSVMGYDVDSRAMSKSPRPYKERAEDGISDFNPRLAVSTIRFGPLAEVVDHADIVFIAVQTPHGPAFEGVTPIPAERADFDYRYLVKAFHEVVRYVRRPTVVSVISTVLPGTLRRELVPLASPDVMLAYNPYFIAMGTAMSNFLNPEFILCGSESNHALAMLRKFYGTITEAPFYQSSIESAELIKVVYNTFISTKIAFGNTVMEICHKVPGADADQVIGGLQLAQQRIISAKYLSGGMGDGGGCHPRDNIAMSWLAKNRGLSFDWFENIMLARERQTEWLADLMEQHDLPKAILGYSFKPESNITTGSPALLLKHFLEQRGHRVLAHDPYVDGYEIDPSELGPMVFLIGVKHDKFLKYRFPAGSVIIDPWRYMPARAEVNIIALGHANSGAAVADQGLLATA